MRKTVKVTLSRDVLADAELAYHAQRAHADNPVEMAEYTRILARLFRELACDVGSQSSVLLAALTQAADDCDEEAWTAQQQVTLDRW